MESQKLIDFIGKRAVRIAKNAVGNVEVYEDEVTGVLFKKGESPEIRFGKYKWCAASTVFPLEEKTKKMQELKNMSI